MRYTLLIYTNEADRPQWGTPAGDAEAKGYDDFHGEVTKRGVFRAGEPLQRVADATSVRVRNGDTQISDGPAVQNPEQLGGWYLLECDDLDQALELAEDPRGQLRHDRGPSRPGPLLLAVSR